MEQMKYEDALSFFSELFAGQHHIPGGKLYEFGFGWMIKMRTNSLATFDSGTLTRLVFMSHKYLVRAEIIQNGFHGYKICITQRQAHGKMWERHPCIGEALDDFNRYSTRDKL